MSSVVGLKEKIGAGFLVAMLVTNPLTGGYIALGIETGFYWLLVHGAWVSLLAGLYLVGLGAFYYAKSEKLRLPVGKPDTQAYIEY